MSAIHASSLRARLKDSGLYWSLSRCGAANESSGFWISFSFRKLTISFQRSVFTTFRTALGSTVCKD